MRIGFISAWPIYQGTTIDRYAHSLIQGIGAAANEHGCNLLLGCGFSITGNSPEQRSFWPVAGPGTNFVPVGPWNTDGLIIVPDELPEEQLQYVRDLLASGFPVIFTTPEGPGPVVTVDNTDGIRQAFMHLRQHGHRQIAFIAGHLKKGGDSEERLRAYRDSLRLAGLPEDPRLIAFGEHRRDGGVTAMRQILETGAPFTALMASNDLSCLGAIQCLTETGRLIPEDVAVIGFDDILDARALSPPLTTVRHPTFHVGYQAVVTLLEYIGGQRSGVSRVTVPTRLIVRQSCGCRAAGDVLPLPLPSREAEPAMALTGLAHAMAEAACIEAHNSLLEDIEERCARFLQRFIESLEQQEAHILLGEIRQALAWAEESGEDAHIWQAATAVIYQYLDALLKPAPSVDPAFAASLLDRVRLEVSDQIQRQTTHAMLAHMNMTSQLGSMTAELLTAMNVPESSAILARHLPELGIQNALVALYEAGAEDEISQCSVLMSAGLPAGNNGRRFAVRKFPLLDIYAPHKPLQLIILPLEIDGKSVGFVAFQAPNPELCAAIVYNLSAALRLSRLYGEALEGRRLAEEANHLKNRFLSMVSHELRTPLSLIVGLSEMVLREQQETSGLAPSATQDLEQINLSAQHLGRLLGDVLDLASSDAGKLHMLCQPLDLAEVLREVAATGEQMARAGGLGWRASIPPGGPWVFGDRTRLRQVVLNLLSNAVKFTEQGEVALEVEVHEQQVTVSVSDTGIGIPPQEQASIFQEFYRSERSVRDGYTGLGLGLAVCKQLVQHHDGTIGLQSPLKAGRGSKVYFTLPVMVDWSAQEPLALATAKPTILLLVGQMDTSTGLKPYLEGRGFELQTHLVDKDAGWLAAAMAQPPAAVVIDCAVAESQSWEIISMLKRQEITENIPVLVYALNAEQNQGELLELDYLLKPLRLEQLSRELKRRGLESQHTILVVDDDADVLAIHSRIVQQAGYQVLQARNGQEALAVIDHTPPDMILLDLIMPEMDGFQVLDHLRTQAATRNIPVIVVTGQVLTDEDMERLNRGVAAVLSKGLFTANETLALIEAKLARQSELSSTSQRFVRRAIAFVQAHYAESISREAIARHIAISPDYLTDCFRQVLGITPMTYLTRYRIQRAKLLLETTELSITQIALETGFSDISHFTRTFKREVGVSPYRYRRGQHTCLQ